jgi:DNA-binding NarL/FixJ family response regulator
MKPITVLLADDHDILRMGLQVLLQAEGDIEVVGQAANGRLAVEMAKKLTPHVVLMDIAMPGLNGLEATRQIVLAVPSAAVLILSAYSDDDYIDRMVAMGAAGYVLKQSPGRVVAQAIRDVTNGKSFFDAFISKRLQDGARRAPGATTASSPVPGRRELTSREEEVLQLIAEGSPNKEIASDLGISIKTVEKHRQHLMDKLKIHNTAGLTRYAIAAGVVESSRRSAQE